MVCVAQHLVRRGAASEVFHAPAAQGWSAWWLWSVLRVQQFRRLMGVTIVREFARLRIRRVPFLGVPREFVRDRARGRRVVQEVPAHGRHAGDFFGHQGRMFHR